MASPQAPPAADHTRADRPLGPEIQGPPTPQPGPSKASRARPRQATAESGPALARASCPGARNHQRTGGILQRQGMMVGQRCMEGTPRPLQFQPIPALALDFNLQPPSVKQFDSTLVSSIPQGMKQAWKKKPRAPSIRRPPRARDPQENHRMDNRGPHPEKGRGEPEGGTPDSHSIDTQGAVMASPQAPPAADHTRADRPLGPEIQGPPTPQPGPSKASRARPRQATAESGPALARASCPGARNHQRTGGILQRQGMMVGWGSTEMMSEVESKARPDT
ncbi:unnamed protein product [Leuciscus chuanchicus]